MEKSTSGKESQWKTESVLIYGRLNKFRESVRYALPLTLPIFDRRRGCQYFSSSDLEIGYQQIPPDLQSQDLLGICTTFGRFKYTGMPFGLNCAQAVFRQAIELVFLGVVPSHVQIFLKHGEQDVRRTHAKRLLSTGETQGKELHGHPE